MVSVYYWLYICIGKILSIIPLLIFFYIFWIFLLIILFISTFIKFYFNNSKENAWRLTLDRLDHPNYDSVMYLYIAFFFLLASFPWGLIPATICLGIAIYSNDLAWRQTVGYMFWSLPDDTKLKISNSIKNVKDKYDIIFYKTLILIFLHFLKTVFLKFQISLKKQLIFEIQLLRVLLSFNVLATNFFNWTTAKGLNKTKKPLIRLPWVNSYSDLEKDSDLPYLTTICLKHIVVFYNFIKTTILSITLVLLYFIYTIFFFKIQFLKQLSVWFIIGMMYFWLISGFNFFLKRYQFGKFTSQIQRFWKRTNTCFWLIEGFLLLIFFYYYLNSSQEPAYMFDYSSLNQENLISLQVISLNVILLSVVIYLMYFVLMRLNSNSWNQITLYLIVISVFVFSSFFIETYQFYYVISVFNERLWVFNEEESMWSIDVDNPILRTKHQYLLVCLIAKYWHFLFIFLSWVFFLMKSYERRKITYSLFGANLQNMIILYVLNFACYLQWFKWVYRRFFDIPYTWFFTSIDNKFMFKLFHEISLVISHIVSFNGSLVSFQSFIVKSLSIWNVDSLAVWKFI